MLEEQWSRRDHLIQMISDPLLHREHTHLMQELGALESALGISGADKPLATGDRLTDYLIARQLSGEITPEDLDLTEDDL